MPDPAGELLSGAVENATFLIFFTPFLRFLKYRVYNDSLMDLLLCHYESREAISGSELNAQKSGKLADFLPHFGSQNSKSSTRGKGRIRGSPARHFRHLEGRKRVKLLSFFSD